MRRTGIVAVAAVLFGVLVPPARSDEGAAKAKGAVVGRILVLGTPTAGTVEVRRRMDDGYWAFEEGPAFAADAEVDVAEGATVSLKVR